MLLKSKLSDMENKEIIDDGTTAIPEAGPAGGNNGNGENPDRKNTASEEKLPPRKPFLRFLRVVLLFISAIIIILASVLFVFYVVPVLTEMGPKNKSAYSDNEDLKKDAEYKKQIGLVNKDIQRLSTKYNAYTSGQSYIVINTTDNRFSLFTNKNLIREGSCSTGSYIMLQAASGNKKWVFKTPRGKYWIHGKKTNPVWKRPDWSFVEEGSKIPSANDDSRYEYGVLGDYALTLGDGYMIHGTIYKRFLGMPVTHGCVRLNDDDLKVVYNTLNIGSKVYIF
jgi:lipoprotein-anchoring transpeptidase ErfK/SrfK